MAPWPEVGERKAPDKEDHTCTVESPTRGDLVITAEIGHASVGDQVSKPEDKEVLTLDETQLKALLDEAITYKNPKDREGKSELFKELLHEAETDQSDSKGTGKLPKSYYNLPPKKRYNRLQGRECGVGVSTSRGGSLQNLHALGMEGGRGVRNRRTGLVSARQREGGSLPSDVNVHDVDTICPNYTTQATLQVTEAPATLQTTPVPNGIDLIPNSTSNIDLDYNPEDFSVAPTPCTKEEISTMRQLCNIAKLEMNDQFEELKQVFLVDSDSLDKSLNLIPGEDKLKNNSRKIDFTSQFQALKNQFHEVTNAMEGLVGAEDSYRNYYEQEYCKEAPKSKNKNTCSNNTAKLMEKYITLKEVKPTRPSPDVKPISTDVNPNDTNILSPLLPKVLNVMDQPQQLTTDVVLVFDPNTQQKFLGLQKNDERLWDSCNSGKAATLLNSLVDPSEEVELTGRTFILPLPAHWRRYSSCTFFDIRELTARFAVLNKEPTQSKVKPLDENGNALRSVDPISYQDKRKPRRANKAKNDRNSRDFMSNEIEGYRGGADIETVMEFIENTSNLEVQKSNKNRPNETRSVKGRTKGEESRSIKLRAREKMKRCTSLEEVSKTKMEDLTEEGSNERINVSTISRTKNKVTIDDTELGKMSSWNDLRKTTTKNSNSIVEIKMSQEGIQDSEFHIVTKRHRKKKRRTVNRGGTEQVETKPVFSAHDRTLEYRHRTVQSVSPQTRRKSASSVPPSDKSDSSDLDSVHSLPVSSTTTRTKVGMSSVSGSSTSQASYADIAKTANICQEVSKGKCASDFPCAESKAPLMLPASYPTKRDAMTDTTCDNPVHFNKEYPPLDFKPIDTSNTYKKTEYFRPKHLKTGEKVILKTASAIVIPVPIDMCENVPESSAVPSPCDKLRKRPPVIIVYEPKSLNQALSELTFGFEVNRHLLESDSSVCNLSKSQSPPVITPQPSHSAISRDASLEEMANFLQSAWDQTMKDLQENKAAKYYNGD